MKLLTRAIDLLLDLAAFGVGLKFDKVPAPHPGGPVSVSPASPVPLPVEAGEPATTLGFVAYLRAEGG